MRFTNLHLHDKAVHFLGNRQSATKRKGVGDIIVQNKPGCNEKHIEKHSLDLAPKSFERK